ncbi:hypothetical protein M011DRAFT_236973 [Sporormia fimetaria CBS 119925]|uniref:Zn(2)-C6 fungal-type domain-containing protein n=1 Tax=Sporormia fimetaria CBS 119925 TaxID=1340428 RepID=A0A6A6VI71_9PLEO|nr:hypothetical protein M011DRAFT_236973 [Sporormia fimetaria CBS 119925]
MPGGAFSGVACADQFSIATSTQSDDSLDAHIQAQMQKIHTSHGLCQTPPSAMDPPNFFAKNSQSPVLGSTSSAKPYSTGGRQRVISSCLTCRRRKVKCDHVHPVCGACMRGNHTCTYATDQGLGQPAPGRIVKPVFSTAGKGGKVSDVQARLDRLELLLEQAVSTKATPSRERPPHKREPSGHDSDRNPTPSSTGSHGGGISSDNHGGTLLLDEGQSQFVSSLHYALLAEEQIHDIKALLSNRDPEEDGDAPTRNSLVHLLSLGRSRVEVPLRQLLPPAPHRDALLDIYFSSVDPMVRITHKPTLLRKFSSYVQDTQPIAWAIFFSAINTLPPVVCKERFGENKEDLLYRYELGVEISLARENYMTTSSLEVLQGLVLWLTCMTREDDMGKAWALLGLTIRIALNQGLHRDPSLFHSGSMDSITTELRRRLWCQICHLEYRAAECKGQEPSIHDEDFTTMLPRNVEDEDLVEGSPSDTGPYDQDRFTTMTFQLVRFMGMRALRRIVQNTYRLERRMLESGLHGSSYPDPVHELQNIYEQIKIMAEQLHEENERKFLRHCNPSIPLQRLCLGLGSLLEWRCYLLFWLRMPRAYRDVVFPNDIRQSIFEKSINCVEALNNANIDVEAARFQWHIGGNAAFQSIMHILSELQNPSFNPPDRQRALRALRMSRLLKEDNNTKAWIAIKGMIDKVVGDQSIQARSAEPYSQLASPTPTSVPSQMPTYVNTLTPYPYQHTTQPYGVPNAPDMQEPQVLDSTGPQFNWDDVNFNTIVSNVPQQPQETPELDWGFWGEPVNFTDQVNIPFGYEADPQAPFLT